MSKLRIFVADDHQIVREGLKALINSQPDMQVVGEAEDGRAAWLLAKRLLPDVVVMDVSMPDMNGAEATERLRAECPQVKVLALTVYEDRGYLQQLLKAGASGYVLKRAVTEELVRAVRTVARGGSYVDPTLAGKLVSSYIRQDTGGGKQPGVELSEREEQVLRLAAWGYSNKEVGAKLQISVKTVETYKVRLMEKLNLRSRADMVRYALRQGWLQED
ncbi:MAG TPA: response regulator transcription factor [Pyrinomonadaceae bacterium]|jgi:DNA-binding NarL/FixJ family response regulator|nr:response regulator transcription factor [Pyrinomonadaceae bacterium]